jgi:hypothetical protein
LSAPEETLNTQYSPANIEEINNCKREGKRVTQFKGSPGAGLGLGFEERKRPPEVHTNVKLSAEKIESPEDATPPF